MAEVKGKFIILTGMLMKTYKKQLDEADALIMSLTGKHHDELDPEGWYDTKIFNAFMEKYAEGSIAREGGIVILGKQVYPTIKKTAGLPEFKNPLEAIKFEAEGFQGNHRGSDVVPRTFIKTDDRNVIVQAPAPGYNCRLFEGVFLGILEMQGIKTGKVIQTECLRKGGTTCEFSITW